MQSTPKYTVQRIGQGFLLCIFTLIFSAIALFSFQTLLQFFNYPLIPYLELTPFVSIFISSIGACFLPPLFIIGFSRHAHFKQRFWLCFQVQAFFYVFLCLVNTAYIIYTLKTQASLSALSYIFYYSALNRLLLCFYFYVSIRVSLGAMPQPLPYYVHEEYDDNDALSIPGAYLSFQGQNYYHVGQQSTSDVNNDEDTFIYLSQDSVHALGIKRSEHQKVSHKNPSNEHIDGDKQTDERAQHQQQQHQLSTHQNPNTGSQSEPLNAIKSYILLLEKKRNKKMEQKAFTRHETRIPTPIKLAISFANIFACVFILLALFPPFEAHPNFIASSHYLSLFFLYFYLLHQIRKRPYTLWRHAFLWVNLYFFVTEFPFEASIWQVLLLCYFCLQMFITLTFYRRGKNWFIS